MAGFNLVAQLNIQGPNNLNNVVRQIQSAFNNINANVNINMGGARASTLANMNRELAAMRTNLNDVAASANTASAAMAKLAAAVSSVRGGATSSNITVNMRQTAQAAKVASGTMEEFGHASALAVKRFAAFSLAAGPLVGTVTAIKQGVAAAIEYDKEMVRLTQVTGGTSSSIQGLSDTISNLATGLGVASKDLSQISVTLASAGYTAKDVKTALETLAQTRLGSQFEDIKNTTDGAIAAMQQFKLNASDLNNVFGSMTAVARGFAVESRDIVVAVQHAGGAFKSAGGNLEELMALFTSVRATTRESAESIATGFRTIFTRMERPRTLGFLREFGVELQDAKGMFVGPYEAVKRLNAALKDLDPRDVRYAQIIEELGGFRQVSKVIPLIQEFGTAQKALNSALSGHSALAEEAAIAQQSLAVQITKVGEEYTKLMRDMVNSDIFRDLASFAMTFAKALADVVRNLQPIAPMLMAITSIKGVSMLGGYMQGVIGKKFATGGVVPGHGNGDTVPALLTPGEFVIRKSAAQAIGYENLGKVNKYAGGGVVMQIGDIENPGVGVVSSEVGTGTASAVQNSFITMGKARELMGKVSKNNNLSEDEKTNYTKGTGKLFFNNKSKINKNNIDFIDLYESNDQIAMPIAKGIMPQSTFSQFNKTVENGIISTIKDASKISLGNEISSRLSEDRLKQIYNNNNTKALVGTIFEGTLHALHTGNVGAQDRFDFTGSAALDIGKYYKLPPSTTFIDAKESVNSKAMDSVRNKAFGVNFLQLYRQHKKILEEPKTQADFRSSDKESLLNKPSAMYSQNLSEDQKKRLAGKAFGGSISGSDTVPSLLTPGEFVINKDSAAKIGLGNLHAMNNVKKFASGGPVAGGLGAIGGAMMGGAALQTMVGFDSSMGKIIGELSAFTATIMAARMGMANLSDITKNLIGTVGRLSNKSVPADWWGEQKYDRAKDLINRGRKSKNLNPLSDFEDASLYMKTTKAGAIANYGGAALGAAALYFGGSMQNRAMEKAKLAGDDPNKLQSAYNRQMAGNILSGVGTGVMGLGAVGNAIAGPLGGIIGGAIGAVGGLIVGAFRDNKTELRAANSTERANRGMEMLSEAAARISSGKTMDRSADTYRGLSGIGEQLKSLGIERFAGNVTTANSISAQLKGRAGEVEIFKEELVKGSKGLGEFIASGGKVIIKAMAEMQNLPIREIESQIAKEIDIRVKYEGALSRSKEAIRNFTDSLEGTRSYLLAVQGVGESTTKMHSSVSYMGELASGKFSSIPTLQANSNITRAASGDFTAMTGLGDSVKNLFSHAGATGTAMAKDSEDIVKIMAELPRLLRESINQKESPDHYIKTKLGGMDNKSDLINLLSSQIDAKFSAAKGGTEFYTKIKEDSVAFSKDLFGKFGESFMKSLDELQKKFMEESQKVSSSMQAYNAAIEQATKAHVDAVSHRVNSEIKMAEMSARGTSTDVSYEQKTAGFYDIATALMKNSKLGQAGVRVGGAGGGIDDIGRAYISGTNELAKLQKEASETTNSKALNKITKEMKDLSSSTSEYQSVLKYLSNQTQRTAAAMSSFEKASKDKATTTNFLDNYIYASRESQYQQKMGVSYAQRVSSGASNINLMPDDIKTSIKGIYDTFADMPVFLNKKGGMSTGSEIKDQIRIEEGKRMLAGAPPEAIQAVLENGKYKSIEDMLQSKIQTGKMDPAQQAFHNELQKIVDQEKEAFKILEQVPKNMAEEMDRVLNAAITRFEKTIAQQENTTQTNRNVAEANNEQEKAKKLISNRVELGQATKAIDKDFSLRSTLFGGIGEQPGSEAYELARQKKAKEFITTLNKDNGKSTKELKRLNLSDIDIQSELKNIDNKWITGGNTSMEEEISKTIIKLRDQERNTGSKLRPDEIKSAYDKTAYGKLLNNSGFSDTEIQERYTAMNLGGDGTNLRNILKQDLGRMGRKNTILREQISGNLGIDPNAPDSKEFLNKIKNNSFLDTLNSLAKQYENVVRIDIDDTKITTLVDNLAKIADKLSKLPDTSAAVTQIQGMIDAIKTVGATPQTVPAQLDNPVAVSQNKATGGSIFKPQGTDTVPAMLTPGEFVVKKDAVQHYGPSFLKNINEKKFANGGLVSYFEDGGKATDSWYDMKQREIRKKSIIGQQYYPDGYRPDNGYVNRWGEWVGGPSDTPKSGIGGNPAYPRSRLHRMRFAGGGMVRYYADGEQVFGPQSPFNPKKPEIDLLEQKNPIGIINNAKADLKNKSMGNENKLDEFSDFNKNLQKVAYNIDNPDIVQFDTYNGGGNYITDQNSTTIGMEKVDTSMPSIRAISKSEIYHKNIQEKTLARLTKNPNFLNNPTTMARVQKLSRSIEGLDEISNENISDNNLESKKPMSEYMQDKMDKLKAKSDANRDIVAKNRIRAASDEGKAERLSQVSRQRERFAEKESMSYGPKTIKSSDFIGKTVYDAPTSYAHAKFMNSTLNTELSAQPNNRDLQIYGRYTPIANQTKANKSLDIARRANKIYGKSIDRLDSVTGEAFDAELKKTGRAMEKTQITRNQYSWDQSQSDLAYAGGGDKYREHMQIGERWSSQRWGRQNNPYGGVRERRIPGSAYGFATGGVVPGYGNADSVPARLTPGEFVLNKRVTQALANGGLVKGYAGGGNVYNKGGESGGSISSAATLDTSGLTSFIKDIKPIFDNFATLPDKFKGLEEVGKSIEGFNSASETLKTAFSEGVASLSKFKFEINVDSLNSSIANASGIFGGFATSISGVIGEMNGLTGKIDTLSNALGGLVKEIKDKLTVEINVKHSPLEVTVNGQVTQEGASVRDIVMESIKPLENAVGELQKNFK